MLAHHHPYPNPCLHPPSPPLDTEAWPSSLSGLNLLSYLSFPLDHAALKGKNLIFYAYILSVSYSVCLLIDT